MRRRNLVLACLAVPVMAIAATPAPVSAAEQCSVVGIRGASSFELPFVRVAITFAEFGVSGICRFPDGFAAADAAVPYTCSFTANVISGMAAPPVLTGRIVARDNLDGAYQCSLSEFAFTAERCTEWFHFASFEEGNRELAATNEYVPLCASS